MADSRGLGGGRIAELIVSILLLLAVSRGLGELFERLRQSAIIGEVLAGVILGPYLLKIAAETPGQVPSELAAVAELGVFLLVFLAGLEMDIGEVGRAIRGGGFLVGLLGFLLPLLAGASLGLGLGLSTQGALFVGLILGLTALPVSVRILMDLGLSDHPVGKVIVSSAVLSEVAALTMLGVVLNAANAPTFEAVLYLGTLTVLKTALLIMFVLTFVQALKLSAGVTPGAQRRFSSVLAFFRGRESLFSLAVLFVLTFAGVSALLGLHFVIGAFFGGLLLSARLLGEWNFKQVQKTTSAVTLGFLAPIFFGLIGLRFTPDVLLQRPDLAVLVIVIGLVAKITGGYLGTLLAHRSSAMALSVGLGVSLHGVLELVLANLAFELALFPPALFSAVVLQTMVSTVLVPPLLKRAVASIEAEPAEFGVEERRPAAASREAAGRSAASLGALAGYVQDAPLVIVGGGRVALEIASALGPCTVVERDPAQARVAASVLPEARVIVGEGSDEEVLRTAGAGPGAIVLAVTDRDETNEFVVRFARKAGARRIIARTEQAAEADRLRSFGADAVLNTAQETASAILLELYPPDASMVELLVQRESPAVGKPLSALELPRGAAIRSVSRRGRVHVPTPDLLVEPRDSLIVSGVPAALERARRAILGEHAGARPILAAAVAPRDESAVQLLAREILPLAEVSHGAFILGLPWEPPPGEFAARSVAALNPASGSARVVLGFTPSMADLRELLENSKREAKQAAGDAPSDGGSSGRWTLALPRQSVGKAENQISPRRLLAAPAILGVPVWLAVRARRPDSVAAILDGQHEAERAGQLACEVAAWAGARLTLLVIRFEEGTESLEQANYIEGYARSIGLGSVEKAEVDNPPPGAVRKRVQSGFDLVVTTASSRAARGIDLVELALSGGPSILLA